MSKIKTLNPVFMPDFSGINTAFVFDGEFTTSDIKIRNSQSPLATLIPERVENDVVSNVPIESFDDIVPKDIQSTGEYSDYFRYLNKQIKDD